MKHLWLLAHLLLVPGVWPALAAEPDVPRADAAGKAPAAAAVAAGAAATNALPKPLPAYEPSVPVKLRTIVIPLIDFRQTRILDVFEFFRKASEENSPWKNARYKGVNIILQMKDEEIRQIAPITFTTRDMTLQEAIQTICSVANLECEVREKWVTIKAKSPPGKP